MEHDPSAAECWCSQCTNTTIHFNPLTERLEHAATPPSSPESESDILWTKLPTRPWFATLHQRQLRPTPTRGPRPVAHDYLAIFRMEIERPKRILAVSLPGDGLFTLIKGLTNTTPSTNEEGTLVGTLHTYSIQTPYYTAEIPLWLDETADPKAWSTEFLGPEAREVLAVVGAFVVCFQKPINDAGLQSIIDLLENVGEVVKERCGIQWQGVCLAVAMPQSTTPYLEKSFDDWEDMCQDFGFEFVDFESKGRNKFSEPTGLERLKEALETNEWEGDDENGDTTFDFLNKDDDSDHDDASLGFGIDPEEMRDEMAGMKRAIYGGAIGPEEDEDGIQDQDEDEEVEKLQSMMLRLQSVRDMGVDMPEKERKKLAAKTVSEIMKTL